MALLTRLWIQGVSREVTWRIFLLIEQCIDDEGRLTARRPNSPAAVHTSEAPATGRKVS
jgi:hypothetical protein